MRSLVAEEPGTPRGFRDQTGPRPMPLVADHPKGQTSYMSAQQPRWRINLQRVLAILVSAGLLGDAVGSWWNEELPLFVKLLYKTVAEPIVIVLVLRWAWRSPKPPDHAAWDSWKPSGPSSTVEDPTSPRVKSRPNGVRPPDRKPGPRQA